MNDSESGLLNQLWVEKYRPRTINDVVLNDKQKVFFQKCLEKGEIPHVLFYGPPGSGKTTLARILINDLIENEMDVLCLNGSDSTGVDFVRETIVPFLKTPPMSSRFKLVFIDESEFMSKNAQASLRNVMESYASNGRFIMTANYENKIIDPLLSRLTSFEMRTMPKDFVIKFINGILDNESVEHDEATVTRTVEALMPDIRKIINKVQQHVVDGKLQAIKQEELVTVENKLLGLVIELCDCISNQQNLGISNRVYSTVLTLLNSKDCPDIVKMYDLLFANDKIPAWAKIKVVNYSNRHSAAFNEKQNFMGMLYDIFYAGLQYQKLLGVKR